MKDKKQQDIRSNRILERLERVIKTLAKEQIEIRREQAEIRKELQKAMTRVDEAMARVDEAMARVDGAVNAIQLASGGIQRRAGRRLEDTMAGVFRYALGMKDIKPESIKLRQKIPLGEKTIEVDLMMHNNKVYMFEVSFYVDDDKAEKLGERIDAVCKHLGLKREDTEIILISLDRSLEAMETARRYGIILIP
jgi:hypothetical protein